MIRQSLFFLAFAGLAATAATGAAPPQSLEAGVLRPGPPPLERLVKPLGLTTAQQSKLRPVFKQAEAQAADDVRNSEPAQLEATLKMHEADFHTRLAEVLTPDQLARYERMTAGLRAAERTPETHGAHGHRDADTPATAIKEH